MAFFVVAILGCAAFVAFCSLHPTELVAPDYYEQEVRYQGQIDQLNRAQAMCDGASVEFDRVSKQISISLPSDHAKASATGTIELYRPSSAGLDRKFQLRLQTDGRHIIEAGALHPGLWRIRVRWSARGQDFLLDRKLEIPS